MSKARWAGWLAVGVLGLPLAPARAVDQQDINRAIDKGVQALRDQHGRWRQDEPGAWSLIGLTLLECGAAADDAAVVQLAGRVRADSVTTTRTYSIALHILFLDRLGDPGDVPLIESLAVRLLAGQGSAGGWTYDCPRISDQEVRRLEAHVKGQQQLVGRRMPPRGEGDGRRTVRDLPAPIQQQLKEIQNAVPLNVRWGGDNSNTQFAALALWVARRHGLPVELAMRRLDARFRTSQLADGGWPYVNPGPGAGNYPSTPTMTCAGLMALAIAYGSEAEARAQQKHRDLEKDHLFGTGLRALSTTIDNPVGDSKRPVPQAAGKSYYFLWTLERLCVILDLKTLSKKDWYAWGAEILLANQGADGLWRGNYAEYGADTCFALLFLKRSNLARDLTARLRGRLKDEAELRAGGVGGGGLKSLPKRIGSGIAANNDQPEGERPSSAPPPPSAEVKQPPRTQPRPEPARPQTPRSEPPRPQPRAEAPPPEPKKPKDSPPPADTAAARLAEQLVAASRVGRPAILQELRDRKGAEYTEALVRALARLQGEAKEEARDALANRLARMKPATLQEYLKDEEPELRRAAALACAMRELKSQIPALLALLRDSDAAVASAAHTALKSLTGQEIGPDADAWDRWWKLQQRK
jgi:hypothetical protein